MNQATTTPHPRTTLQARLDALDLTLFAKKSGIPRRTLERIKFAEGEYPMAITTRLALNAALKRYEERCKKVAPNV